MIQRIAILGSPRAGKTTLAVDLGRLLRLPVTHSDDLIWLGWSEASEELARRISLAPGIYEGVAVVRALRKMLRAMPTRPVDSCVALWDPVVELSEGQQTMRLGCQTVFAEIEGELRTRGVEVLLGLGGP